MVTVIDVTIIMTRKAKETTVRMTSEKEFAIVLIIKASHIMWRQSAITLNPNLKIVATVAVALQAAAAFQAAAALVLALCQTAVREVTTSTM
eukprot:11554199-Ditylum_brightwellii.AAC.2